ncbi:MAG TPA: PHB depolymerase family esterase [Chroococcales cyanobacterium]|jgi:polyhydroxybutyrate depolymerase
MRDRKPIGERSVEESPQKSLIASSQQEAPTRDDMLSGRLIYQGQARTYHVYLPSNYDRNRSWPLVLAFHGGFGSGKRIARNTGFNEIAEREGFIVVYPDGIDKHWNDGRGTVNTDVDDVGFVRALIDRLVRNRNVDPSRVYATGISNGGQFTQRLACELSDKIAAFAAVASTFPAALRSNCNPKNPVSMLMINSPEDPLVPWQGGEGGGIGGRILSVPETVELWRKHNKCSPVAQTQSLPTIAPNDGTRVRMSRYQGDSPRSEIVLYTIEGGGHTWPDGHDNAVISRVGKTSRQLKGSQAIWNFFKRHSLS